ncbi:MAG: LysM domain [Solirubrobacteraceae bacterium]|jgi:LysM repeat protein|nr:LysM domain [Solirubrobacteraceae bacterium]
MLQAPRIVRWTLPALLLTLVLGGAIIVARSGGDSGPAHAVKGSSAADSKKPRKHRGARRVTVHGGDTATSIARRAKMTLLELLELNPNVDPRLLRPGQKLKISR